MKKDGSQCTYKAKYGSKCGYHKASVDDTLQAMTNRLDRLEERVDLHDDSITFIQSVINTLKAVPFIGKYL
jgi:hypothetical protein